MTKPFKKNFVEFTFVIGCHQKKICRILQFGDTMKISSARISSTNIFSIKVLDALFIHVSKTKLNSIMVTKIYINFGSIYVSFPQNFF